MRIKWNFNHFKNQIKTWTNNIDPINKKVIPIIFCNNTLLFLINSKTTLDVTKNVKEIYQIASTIPAVRISTVLKIKLLSVDINWE